MIDTLHTGKIQLVEVAFDTQKYVVSVTASIWIFVILFALILISVLIKFKSKRFSIRKLEINLGNIGKAEILPTIEDMQIAHKIWSELVTRKAAIPIDPQNDVIIEVYNSWYTLFGKVRDLISNIPAHLLRRDKSTVKIIDISISALNNGLRPHLTKWNARFRDWIEKNKEKYPNLTPQELQSKFPEYDELIKDMKRINSELIQYASELKKIIT